MNEPFQPAGPFYLTVTCETTRGAADATRTLFVDGFETEADAWRGCERVRLGEILAFDEAGDPTSICGDDVLQVMIAKSATADFPRAFLPG